MKNVILAHVLAILWLAISGFANAQLDSTNFVIRDLGSQIYYLGIGPGANSPSYSIDAVSPSESNDPNPTYIGFANEQMTDSANVVMRCFFNAGTNKYRVVIKNTTTSTVLANITFRPTLNQGEYELDLPTGPGIPPSTVRTVDSVRRETLKWSAFGAYFASIQMAAAADADCEYCPQENTPCTAYYPHDDICSGFGSGGSGPFNINKVRINVPCYGNIWVDLIACCITHDRQLWCTQMSTRGISAQGINFGFFGCVLGTITTEVMSKVPWYCGGALVGLLAGASQGLVVATSAYIVVTFITNGQLIGGDMCYISMGDELNSCMCGGNVRTIRCRDHKEMCAGDLGLLQLTGPTGEECFCDANPHLMEIAPDLPGATYTWHAEGNVTVNPDVQGGRTAQVTATGNGSVTVVVEIPGCEGYTRSFTKNITSGVPSKPVITTYGGNIPTCIPRRPGTLFMVDRDKSKQPAACSTEYRLAFTSNVGGTVIDHTAALQNWSTRANWFTARPDIEGQQFCVTVTARNQCGESEPTVFCLDVDDDCPPTNAIIPGENPSAIPFTGDNEEFGVLYPNPTSDMVNLTLAPSHIGATLSILDLQGNIVSSKLVQSEHETLSLKGMVAGMYVINISAQNAVLSKPLIIAR